MEDTLQQLFHWQSEIGALWRTATIATGKEGKEASKSLEDTYLDRVQSVVKGTSRRSP